MALPARLSGQFNKTSPVLLRKAEIEAWAARTPLDVKESVLTGLARIAGTEAGLPASISTAQSAVEFPDSIAAMAANAIAAKGGKGFEEIATYAPQPVAELVRAMVRENIEDARSALACQASRGAGHHRCQDRLAGAKKSP